MPVTVKKIESYKNFGACLCVSNGNIEVYITTEIGPRILRFGFVGGENLLFNDVDRKVVNSGDAYDRYYYPGAKWCIYGGHRLWISPESEPETYYPDNVPVEYNIFDTGAEFIQEPQKQNGVQFSIRVEITDENEVLLTHKVKNISESEKTFAPWTITVLNKGGIEIIPQNQRNTGLLPNRKVAFWPYSDTNDARLYFGKKYIALRQDETAKTNFKIGTDNEAGRALYLLDDMIFTQEYTHMQDAEYPDGGVSFESYTSPEILEMETLGALRPVLAGETVLHIEKWRLCKNTKHIDPKDETAVENLLKNL